MFDVHVSPMRMFGTHHQVLLVVVVECCSSYVVALFTAEVVGKDSKRYRLRTGMRKGPDIYQQVANSALLELSHGNEAEFAEPIRVDLLRATAPALG
jgi:hypothetical protein